MKIPMCDVCKKAKHIGKIELKIVSHDDSQILIKFNKEMLNTWQFLNYLAPLAKLDTLMIVYELIRLITNGVTKK